MLNKVEQWIRLNTLNILTTIFERFVNSQQNTYKINKKG